ncbi:MAG: hypothetical protein COS35_06560 [Zetaproteobacteria bacterium CG02_land_8_20_14_3_00_50_9]|nr:MAG: hypothetical protein AUJ57_00105 [Zetaproteobacteria bacterium CG1_02_53_45]PIV30499.1 MAG: hypothetical protein COS35_06560 [Zetaproteobacteria bacterium CG02_land_8_20_14_3_00_50_9]PIY56785.1 MAG: hypothetical protein COZ00_02350 [Zetaproteobacteria bacterium CG_4_10_14_0_8_um_filter_49_80]
MGLAEHKREDRRLLILKALASENDYAISDMVIRSMLREYGHSESADTIRTDIAWLDEQGLVTSERVGVATVAIITDRGLDVANGHSIVPGVRRPRPGECNG